MRGNKRATWAGLATAALAAIALLAACAPAPSAAPRAPAAAAEASPAAQPAAGADWRAEWDAVLAAAKREGKVVVAGPPGQNFRDAAIEFRKKYPEITVEYTGAIGRDIQTKMLTERRADQYLWDVFINGAATSMALKAQATFDPLRPALILPEVVDSSKWLDGFDEGFLDKEGQFVYGFTGFLSTNVLVNREVIPEGELSSVEQLVDPKWKGKMSWHEPRENGSGSQAAGYWMLLKNEDWLRQLFEQDVTTTRDNRQQVEWVIHNRYPIALGPGTEAINEFRRNGFDKEITRLEHGTPLGSRLTTGFDNVMLVNRAPHPNAARVYLNWLLSQEGQASWVRITELNSRRLDVGGPPETAPRPGVTYLNNSKEEYLPYIDKAIELAKNVLK